LAVSTGGKVYMVIGFIVMFMGLFLSMSSLVAIFLILAGIVTMIQGYKLKSGEQYRQLPQGNLATIILDYQAKGIQLAEELYRFGRNERYLWFHKSIID
jgi:hypothetical protein